MDLLKYPEINFFKEGLAELGIKLSDYQLEQFITYYELLIEKNKVMNLTAITEPKEVISKHFIDSLALVKVCSLTDEKVIDIGTGAGFPGIPLKIIYPNTSIILFDSLKKRLNFLDEVITKLDLSKINTLHGRAEDYGKDLKYREQFDVCVSRAVAKLPVLIELCVPFIKKGGHFISYKSGNIDEEIDLAKNALKILRTEISKKEVFLLPGTDMERSLLLLKKVAETPKGYPRVAGKAIKSPL
jgi:16S rRNA (guanine527-N7)-methyltransferase